MRLDNNPIESIYKTQEKEITRTKDLVDFRFLDSSFEALIDDVIGMTHRKIISDLEIWNQYFIITLRERKLVMRVGFCGQFKNSMISDRKFIMPMLSLKKISGNFQFHRRDSIGEIPLKKPSECLLGCGVQF